ncbi:MAG: radical SAM protein [Dehalococcoidales bacterium]|jgi:organic radical activating enzyme
MITALVVMFNAEQMLDEHLISLWFCDEIIAIDLGSSDNSVNIAKKYNCNIKHHTWVPMGEMAWTHYINEARNDWILVADPDEIITPKLAEKINETIDTIPDDVGTILLPYRHHFLGKRIETSMWGEIHYIPKLFHKNRVDVTCTVHRPFTIKQNYKNIILKIENNDDSEVVLHYPAENIVFMLTKLFRYSLLEGESRFKHGEKWTFKSCTLAISRSIYYHFKQTNGIRNPSSILLGAIFVTYDAVSQFTLMVYQHHYKSRSLDILQIEPTRRCNMNCKHCNRKDNNGYISIEIFAKILSLHPYVKTIKIQGLGEPLLHPNIDKLIQMARNHGSRVMIITNGSLPIPEGIDDLVISMETIDPIKYKELRGYDIGRVLTNIEDIRTKQKVTLNCVQTHLTNKTDVENIKRYANLSGMDVWLTPMEVWVDPLHPDYQGSRDHALQACDIHGTIPCKRQKTCQWMKKSKYYDYLGREHPCCIRMTDEYILSLVDLELCCKRCPI